MKKLNVLVLCEKSASVRSYCESLGHNAWSNDILPTDIPGNHFLGDAFEIPGLLKNESPWCQSLNEKSRIIPGKSLLVKSPGSVARFSPSIPSASPVPGMSPGLLSLDKQRGSSRSIKGQKGYWDLLIAFPPCTYLVKSQIHLTQKSKSRMKKSLMAIDFIKRIYQLPIRHIAIENPPGLLSKYFKLPAQTIHPYYFGDEYKKQISLWLYNLPKLSYSRHNLFVMKREGRKFKSSQNHTNSRMDKYLKSEIKASWIYYPNLIKSMIDQWTEFILRYDYNIQTFKGYNNDR